MDRPGRCGVAAAAFVLVGVSIIGGDEADPQGIEIALEATDVAPDAAGIVRIDETPLGTRLVLDVSGRAPVVLKGLVG